MNRLVCDDPEWLPCLQGQEEGMLWLRSLSLPAEIARGGTRAGHGGRAEWQKAGQLSASSAGQERKSDRLESKKQPSRTQACPELILI